MARRTKEEAQVTRSSLLDAAERVFLSNGVARTSLAQIAQEAGVTRGALYWHFKDKADIFNAMMERITLPFESNLAVVAEAADGQGDAIDMLVENVRRSMCRVANDAQTRRVLEIATLMVEYTNDLGALRTRHVQAVQGNVARLTQVLSRAARQRAVGLPAPVPVIAMAMDGLIHGLVLRWLLAQDFVLEEVVLQGVCAYLHGIGLPPTCDQG